MSSSPLPGRPLPGRVVVITGAAGALGSTVLSTLLASDHAVAAVDVSAASGRLAELCAPHGPRALACAGDVRDPAFWAEAMSKIEATLGTPTGATFIAGGWDGGAPLHEAKSDALARMLEMNVETAFHSMRAVLPGMVARKSGSIVVVGSRAVERPWDSAGAAAYAASKSAVVAMARAAAAEVLAYGVRINAVLPSIIDTKANRASMPKADPSRWVSAESLAGVIAFLLSEASRDISGAAIPVYARV